MFEQQTKSRLIGGLEPREMNLVNKGEEMNLRKHVRTAVVTNLYSGNPWSELMQASLPPWVCDQKCYENGC